MCELGRVAFGFTWNGFNTQLINLSGGSRREHNLILQFCKESIPERIILKHIQNTRDTYFTSGCLISSKRCVGENTFIFIFIKIRNMIFVLFLANTTLAAVTAYILAAAGEFVDSQTAVIGTSTTVCHRSCIFQLVDLINGEHSRFCAFLMAFTGNQCGTEGTHDSGNIRTDSFAAGNLFETSQNCIIVESTTLYNDVSAKFGSIRNLDNLIECIFDNRVSKTCGNIGYFSSFFLCLFNFGIHENGTSGTKINRMLCENSSFCEILYCIIQGFGKGFNKGPASGGTCFIQLYAVNGLVADLDTFHILSADIQDTVYLRVKESSCIVMGYGLNLALIQDQGSLDQRFSVTCRAGISNLCAFRKQLIDFFNRTDSGF